MLRVERHRACTAPLVLDVPTTGDVYLFVAGGKAAGKSDASVLVGMNDTTLFHRSAASAGALTTSQLPTTFAKPVTFVYPHGKLQPATGTSPPFLHPSFRSPHLDSRPDVRSFWAPDSYILGPVLHKGTVSHGRTRCRPFELGTRRCEWMDQR